MSVQVEYTCTRNAICFKMALMSVGCVQKSVPKDSDRCTIPGL